MIDKEDYVRARVRANLLGAGFPQVKVDEAMGKIEQMPESLVESYFEMIKDDLKTRLKNDNDYREKKRADGTTAFTFLDKL